eukprot:1750171-Amphidinium_carterae.1
MPGPFWAGREVQTSHFPASRQCWGLQYHAASRGVPPLVRPGSICLAGLYLGTSLKVFFSPFSHGEVG